jgi:hypothetical protein
MEAKQVHEEVIKKFGRASYPNPARTDHAGRYERTGTRNYEHASLHVLCPQC